MRQGDSAYPSASTRMVLGALARRGVVRPRLTSEHGRLQAAGAHAVTLDARRLAWATDRPVWHGPRKTGVLAFRAGRATLLLPAASAAWVLLNPGPLPVAAERTANDQ